MLDGSLVSAFRFFRSQGSYIVGECAKSALHLAKAEALALQLNWTCAWEYDDDPDYSFVEDWSEKDRKEFNSRNHECLVALMRNERREVVASLGGIIDPDNKYQRVIEAELALEGLAEWKPVGAAIW
jgi:hypothetical protein